MTKTLPSSTCASITEYTSKNLTTWQTSTHIPLDGCPNPRSPCLVLGVYSRSLQHMKTWVPRSQFHMRLSMMLGAARSQVRATCYRRSLHHAALSTKALFGAVVAPAHRRRRITTYAPRLTHLTALVSRGGLPGRRPHRLP
jgi:hypothetical protein